MVTRKAIGSVAEDYRDIVVATVCSHSSLQIFHGARQEGFKTLGIAIGKQPRFYDAFPLARPDEFLLVDSYKEIADHADDLIARQVVTVPHGSFVEYMGADTFAKLRVPTFGNRSVLAWECQERRDPRPVTYAPGSQLGEQASVKRERPWLRWQWHRTSERARRGTEARVFRSGRSATVEVSTPKA